MKEIKKVLFLMLFLLVLGAASVKAQVRIGGNAAPNGAAVLDLNATDATNNGTKGLALPRVNLTSNTMQLTTGVTNLTGMLVYNTTTTLGQIGIFYWNGATWVKASLPSTSAADSGKFLMSNGTTVVFSELWSDAYDNTVDSIKTSRPLRPVSWSVVVDTVVRVTPVRGKWTRVYVFGLRLGDLCYPSSIPGIFSLWVDKSDAMLAIPHAFNVGVPNTLGFRCIRPSF